MLSASTTPETLMATVTIDPTVSAHSAAATVSAEDGGLSVLLALDGTRQCDGAIALSSWLANARGSHVNVISVVEPTCNVLRDELAADAYADRGAARRHVVLDQIDGEDPYESPWPVTVVAGSPATLIADAANASSIDLLVLGLPRRDTIALRADNVLRVARRVKKPMVAVGNSLRIPPTCCVAAIDFTRSSLLAARSASTLLAPGATLFLAHVQPPLQGDDSRLQSIYSQGIVGAFERLTHELGAPSDVRVKHVLLRGDPRVELPSFCDHVNADLMAVGTSQVDVAHLHRARLSSSFVRNGTRSVLIAPALPRRHGAPYWDD
jgi:nucleotide-binding universal stress UspA family protein